MLISSFQIVSFLGKERMVEFLGLKTNEERISFMYRHEAYRPLLQVFLWLINSDDVAADIAPLPPASQTPRINSSDNQEGRRVVRKGRKGCDAQSSNEVDFDDPDEEPWARKAFNNQQNLKILFLQINLVVKDQTTNHQSP